MIVIPYILPYRIQILYRNKGEPDMNRVVVFLSLISILLCSFVGCSTEVVNTEPFIMLTLEQLALRNRTEQDILEAASNTPYSELITLKVDPSKINELIHSAEFLLGVPGQQLGGINPDATMGEIRSITLSEFNEIYPIECVRQISDDRCYVIYLNQFGDPIYLCFVKVHNYNKYYLHKFLNCPVYSSDKTLIPRVTTIDMFMDNVTSPKKPNSSGRMSCILRGQNKVLRLCFTYPKKVDASTVKVLSSITDITYSYEILEQDYPK